MRMILMNRGHFFIVYFIFKLFTEHLVKFQL